MLNKISGKICSGIIALCLVASVGSRCAWAAESATNPYLSGYKDFMSGALPPAPGVYIRNDVIYYTGNIGKSVVGGRVDLNLNEWFVTDVLAPTVVTPYHFAGGTYAYGVTLPLVAINVNASADARVFSRSNSDEAFNIGDIYLTPLILGWNHNNFHWNFAFSIVTPTGHYRNGALANTSLNYWSFLPQFSITYFEPKTGLDVSAAVVYALNTKNNATDYQTGDIFDMDWAVGKQLTPHWKLGAVGYFTDQTTGDTGSGAVLGSNKMSVWAIGPAATYSFLVAKHPFSVLAKWTHQVSTTKTFQGDTVTAAISFPFE